MAVNWRRRLLAVIPWVGILLLLLGVLEISRWGYALAIPTLAVIGAANFLLFDRAVVIEPCGFRCRGCGYDLQGQVAPRCPECGRQLDADEAALLQRWQPDAQASVRPLRRWRDWVWMAIAMILTAALMAGVLLTKYGPRPRPPGAPPSGTGGSAAQPPSSAGTPAPPL